MADKVQIPPDPPRLYPVPHAAILARSSFRQVEALIVLRSQMKDVDLLDDQPAFDYSAVFAFLWRYQSKSLS